MKQNEKKAAAIWFVLMRFKVDRTSMYDRSLIDAFIKILIVIIHNILIDKTQP